MRTAGWTVVHRRTGDPHSDVDARFTGLRDELCSTREGPRGQLRKIRSLLQGVLRPEEVELVRNGSVHERSGL